MATDFVVLRVPVEQKAWLRAVAKAQDRTVSSVLRQLIKAAIAGQIPAEPPSTAGGSPAL